MDVPTQLSNLQGQILLQLLIARCRGNGKPARDGGVELKFRSARTFVVEGSLGHLDLVALG